MVSTCFILRFYGQALINTANWQRVLCIRFALYERSRTRNHRPIFPADYHFRNLLIAAHPFSSQLQNERYKIKDFSGTVPQNCFLNNKRKYWVYGWNMSQQPVHRLTAVCSCPPWARKELFVCLHQQALFCLRTVLGSFEISLQTASSLSSLPGSLKSSSQISLFLSCNHSLLPA